MRHSARGRAGLGLGAWLLAGPALAAPPVGFVEGGPWTGSGPAPVTVALLILVESGAAPRDEARALRQLLEHSHRAGVWPAQVAFRPQSLSALMAADRDLPRLLAELQPVLLLVGPAGADDGLAACAALGRALDRVPASGGGRVGELLREDTDLVPLARSRSDEALPLMADWGIVPSPRLLAGSGSGRSTVEDLARWQRSWDLARRMASGPSRVAPADAEAALDALASLAALARSVGLDPFVVPGLDRLLDAGTRAALPPWRWPLAALPLERARLSAAVEADPAASTAALATTLGPLARHALQRADAGREMSARLAELPETSRWSGTIALRVEDVRPGVEGAAGLEAAAALLGALGQHPRYEAPDAAVAQARAQWSEAARAALRWPAAFGLPPSSAGLLKAEEVGSLHREYRRRDQHRRARQR